MQFLVAGWYLICNADKKPVALGHDCPVNNSFHTRMVRCPTCDEFVCHRCGGMAPNAAINLGWCAKLVEELDCGPCWKQQDPANRHLFETAEKIKNEER